MAPTIRSAVVLVALGAVTTGCAGAADGPREIVAEPDWLKRAILSGKDSSQQAADGTDVRDVNGDGWLDVASAWQQRGRTIVHINPGAGGIASEWPFVPVDFEINAKDAEDAVFGDIDRDGNVDVVTALAENGRKLLVQWAPDASLYLDRTRWQSGELDPSNRRDWKRAEVADLDGANFEDIVAGSQDGGLFVYLSPASPRDMTAWRRLTITTSLGRLKDLAVRDMDGDGDLDIIVNDRATLAWYQNPRPNLAGVWRRHQVEDLKDLGNLMNVADIDQDGLEDLIIADNRRAVAGRVAAWYRRLDDTGRRWTKYPVFVRGGRPFRGGADRSKGVAVGDVDGDGDNDIVLNVNATKGYKVYWLSADRPTARRWTAHPISTEGQKYDNIDLVDLDRDGDLDVVTSEEVKRLGVIWFENP